MIVACSGGEPRRLEPALHQIALGDLDLLVLGIARQLDHLHAVAQRTGDGVEHVGRADEHHARQVERHREIIVAEGRVLLGVEHLQQRRRRIAVEALAELVHLVEHHDGIARLGLADRLDHVAGQRPDIGAAMAPDLGLVMHAAERQPHEFAARGARDRLAERGLAHAGRADEAQDRALAVRLQLAHGEIFEDALLDLGQAVMVLVEDAARFGDIDALLGELRPGQLDQPIEIGADHAVLGRGLGHALEPLQLLARLLFGLLGHAGLLDRLAEFGDLGLRVLALAELFLDLAELLAQDVLALAAGEQFLRLLADLLRQAQHLDLLREIAQQLVEPVADIEGLEQVLLLGRLEVRDVGDEIGERRRRLHLIDGGRDLRRHVGQQRDYLAGALLQLMHARGDLGREDFGLADLLDARDQERIARQELAHAEAPRAAGDQMMVAVGRGDVAQDLGDGADLMQMLRAGRVDRGSFCSSTPTGRSDLAASCAPAIDCGRPSVIGTTMPGKSTALRVGTRISAPSGSCSSGPSLAAAPGAGAADCAGPGSVCGASAERGVVCSMSFMVSTGTRVTQDLTKVRIRQPLRSSRSASCRWAVRVMRRSKRP